MLSITSITLKCNLFNHQIIDGEYYIFPITKVIPLWIQWSFFFLHHTHYFVMWSNWWWMKVLLLSKNELMLSINFFVNSVDDLMVNKINNFINSFTLHLSNHQGDSFMNPMVTLLSSSHTLQSNVKQLMMNEGHSSFAEWRKESNVLHHFHYTKVQSF